MKIFIVLTKSPGKIRNIAVYRFLISFLVSKLSRFKDWKSDKKNGTEVWVKINQN